MDDLFDDGSLYPSKMPPSVKAAAALTLLFAVYGLAMSPPILLTGLFVGPHMLLAGALHAALGAILLVGWSALWLRKRWGRWLLTFVSAGMACVLSAAIGRDWWLARTIPDGAQFFLLIAGLFALIAAFLLTRPSGAWFAQK